MKESSYNCIWLYWLKTVNQIILGGSDPYSPRGVWVTVGAIPPGMVNKDLFNVPIFDIIWQFFFITYVYKLFLKNITLTINTCTVENSVLSMPKNIYKHMKFFPVPLKISSAPNLARVPLICYCWNKSCSCMRLFVLSTLLFY